MVKPERYFNHSFDRLETIIRHCAKTQQMNQLDEILGDLNMILLDRRATGERSINKSVRILNSRNPPIPKYDYIPLSFEELINLQDAYKQLKNRFG